ncbi:MAG TPA: hypothetical protein VFU37_11300 [Pyrinomonadaceae bacterium]|nr:hypothetical protein [Pyrinomonadaceae bacterium]
MLAAAAVLFALAALGGLILAGLHLKTKGAPIPLAVVHGVLAAAALALLIIAVTQMASAGAVGVALAIFVVAALGGFVLFAMHLMKKMLPPGLIVVHGLVAVVAFAVLLISLLRS